MNPYVRYMYSYPHQTAYRALDESLSLRNYMHYLSGGGHGLYLHIPFCQAKCGYCNLFSAAGQAEEAADLYLDAVERQARQYGALLKPYCTGFAEVGIGGGMPLSLTVRQLERVFGLFKDNFSFQKDREIHIKTTPGQTDQEKLSVLKDAGVTRVSLGIQSFSDRELKTLGRHETARQAEDALALLQSFRFPRVNVDFIYGIPEQTVRSLLTSLKRALLYAPDEITLYPLYIRPQTALWNTFHGKDAPDSRITLLQYQEATDFLRSSGFRQDSMRKFVREEGCPAFSECGFVSSLALGCGGRSYLGNLHFCTPYAVSEEGCLAQIEAFEATGDYTRITHGFQLTDGEMRRRYVIQHLLVRPGLSLARYKERFAADAVADFPLLGEWMGKRYVRHVGDYLELTETGMGLSDYLGPQLISPQVRQRMEKWEEPS